MKNFFLYITTFITIFSYGQEKFVITENGLSPKFYISKKGSFSKKELYTKTLNWIEENREKHLLSVSSKKENDVIYLISITENAVSLIKQYFNVKYEIKLSFQDGRYRYEPTKIQLKLNSKYDMGWKDLDLSNDSKFFKNGKVLRKYKTYIGNITTLLNELSQELHTYLNIDK